VQSNWVPTAIALGAVALNVAFNAVFYRVGIWGIPLSTALVNVVASVTLVVMLRRRIGLEHLWRTAGVVLRIVLAGSVAAAASLGVWYALDAALGRSLGAQVVSVGAGLAAAGLAYFGAARALGIRELEALLLLRSRRDER
jgi:putative peptidoglycan lipid II flippase